MSFCGPGWLGLCRRRRHPTWNVCRSGSHLVRVQYISLHYLVAETFCNEPLLHYVEYANNTLHFHMASAYTYSFM